MKKLFIFGTGAISEIVYFHFSKEKKYKVSAFVDYKKFIKKKEKFGVKVLEFEKIEKLLPKEEYFAFVALGYKQLNLYRKKIFELLKKKKYKFASYVSSQSNIASNVKIGENCLILENQVIHPFSKIGNNVTLWSGNIIGHHCTIENHCFITSNVIISGNSKIGSCSFIGIKSAIKDGTKVGKNCVLMMNSSIAKNMPNDSTAISQMSEIFDKKNKNIQLIKKKYFNL